MEKFLKENNYYGNIKVQKVNNTIIVSGEIYCTDKQLAKFTEELNKKYSGFIIINSIHHNPLTIIIDDEYITNSPETEDAELDEVNILYSGMLDTNLIKHNTEYKVIQETNKLKINNVVKVLRAIQPLVLDRNLKIIDGELRLQLAIENKFRQVPVVIYDCDGIKADTLRLLMNRSCEFQRWEFSEVDPFVDSVPQIQPLMEPLGFFGTTILPVSYFDDTVVDYIIDPFNEKQKQYKQEEGLAEWAKYRREQMAKLVEEKYTKKKTKVKSKTVSLFNLSPSKEDFLETTNPTEVIEELTDKWDRIAINITDELDAKKKEELLKTGGKWQVSHRTATQKVEDEKKTFITMIENSDLTQPQKDEIIANLEEYASLSLTEIKSKFDLFEE